MVHACVHLHYICSMVYVHSSTCVCVLYVRVCVHVCACLHIYIYMCISYILSRCATAEIQC